MKRSIFLLTSAAVLTATLITAIVFGYMRKNHIETPAAVEDESSQQMIEPAAPENDAADQPGALQNETETGTASPDPQNGKTEDKGKQPAAGKSETAEQNPTKVPPSSDGKQESSEPESNRQEDSKPQTSKPNLSIPETNQPGSFKPILPKPQTPSIPEKPDQGSSSSYIKQVVDLVNQERAKEGLAPLAINQKAEAAAAVRAKEIEQSFSHTRPDGRKFNTVLAEQNLQYRSAGENIAYGQKTPEQVVAGWMMSPGHRANIMNTAFTSIGVGHYQNRAGVHYWVQVFIG